MSTALISLLVIVAAQAPRAPISKGDVFRLSSGGKVVLEYRHTGAPFKPYVVQLRTPSGVNIVRDNVEDHPHHHGLMFAWNVDGVNFWEETPQSGKELAGRAIATRLEVQQGLAWQSPERKTLLTEKRTVRTLAADGIQATLIGWSSEFTRPADAGPPAKIAGAHYNGLGMRFLQEMDGGTFIGPGASSAVVFRGEERLMRGNWCAYRAHVGGHDVTIAMFDHPANPRPVTWFAMARPFGYMAATLRVHESPVELAPGKSLLLQYGVAVWDGRPDEAEIVRAHDAWLLATNSSAKRP